MTGQSLAALELLQIYHKEMSLTAEILHINFLGTIVWKKYLPKDSTVGLFSYDKFEETSKQKVIDLSKLNETFFDNYYLLCTY